MTIHLPGFEPTEEDEERAYGGPRDRDPNRPRDDGGWSLERPAWDSYPPQFRGWRDGQWEAVQEIVTAFQSGAKTVLLDGQTGCLAGDTMIGINRGGKSFQLPISDVVHRFNGGAPPGGRSWDLAIPTTVRRVVGDRIRLGPLAAAVSSGIKETFTIRTLDGKEIRATADHPFLTDGGWVPLGDLKLGIELMVDGGQGTGTPKEKKAIYRQVQNLRAHPYAGRRDLGSGNGRGWSVPAHRIAAEAHLSGLGFWEFVGRIWDGNVEGLHFIDPAEWAVHHLDLNHTNNDVSNLKVLTHAEHAALHAGMGKWMHVAHRTIPDLIVSIERYGEEETFDLTMADEPHNFLANHIAVHNCGKTYIANGVRVEMSKAGLASTATYSCHSLALQDPQWKNDFAPYPVLKGRSNYDITWPGTPRYITAADCTFDMGNPEAGCVWCPNDVGGKKACPYERAKNRALAAPFRCVNHSYLVTESRFVGRFKHPLLIVDEAEMLEPAILSQVSVTLTAKLRSELDLGQPRFVTKEESIKEWLADVVVPGLARDYERYPKHTTDRRTIRARDAAKNRYQQTKFVLESYGSGWVFDRAGDNWALRPVWASHWGAKWIGEKADHILAMSATLVSGEQVALDLGLPAPHVTVKVEGGFDPALRPVYLAPVADLRSVEDPDTGRKSIPLGEYDKLAVGLRGVMARHPRDRILVHTHSYKVARELYSRIASPRVLMYDGGGRDAALKAYLAEDAAVLLAPSLERGVNLPDEMCFPSGTRVLHGDLSWRPIEDTQIGDEVVGIDEFTKARPGGQQGCHHLRYAKVEAVGSRNAESLLRITTTHGVVEATPGHPFLAIIPSRRTSWRPAGKLRVGDRLRWVAEPVKRDESRTAGYLAGFFDGEGCLTQTKRGEGKWQGFKHLSVMGVQAYNSVLDEVRASLDRLEIPYLLRHRSNAGHDNWKPTAEVHVAGNLSAKLRFLSLVRPERLIHNFNIDGMTGRDLFCAEILEIEEVPGGLVHNLTTTSSTYVAEGFAVHNCRVVVWAKVPFPSLGDPVVARRRYSGGPTGARWYAVETIRAVVQGCGRAVRHAEDFAETFILDAAILSLWRKERRLFPSWFVAAIKFDFDTRSLMRDGERITRIQQMARAAREKAGQREPTARPPLVGSRPRPPER